MSTNLNNNNSSQTLFRFAAMRNPELSDPENKQRRFVFRSQQAKGSSKIDSLVNSTTSLQSIFKNPSAINGFTVHTEDSLKTLYPDFYDFAIWVARNKSTATKEEFDKQIELCKTHGSLAVTEVLWDNLTYQVVTQKDFYAKELIMQYLHLAHILENYDTSEESYQDMIKAKVVLPKELFKVSQSNALQTGISTTQRTVYNDQAMKFAEATISLKENQDLVNTLSKLEKTYKKQYDEAYKSAYTAYERETKPAIQAVRKEAAEADRKKQILENRINYLTQLSVADPEKFYANAELDMELHRIKDEIMHITVAEAEIPDFEFSFNTPEIDAAKLGRTMSIQDQNALNKLFGTSSVTEALTGITTFDELNQTIATNNQTLQQIVLTNTVVNQQVSAIVGGVVIPVNSLNVNNQVIPFFARTWRAGMSFNTSMIVTSDINQPKHIISGNYKITNPNQQVVANATLAYTYGAPNVTTLFSGTENLSSTTLDKYEILTLEGEVTLNDGLVYIMKAILNVTSNNTYKFEGPGTFTRKDRGNEGPENPTNPGNPQTPANPGTPVETGVFIPSGFGMKNIGVADYLKVEQSTYCYVEGDVAHIENIMAREYKERSTRRLKRSESQTTKSTESEKEKLTDTTTTERHEMQSEISKIMQESKDFAAQAGVTASWEMMGGAKFGASANASYATHNSKEESTRQAVTEAKDITARALDRIVTKVKEERIDKVLEEYEENNKHGFDNTKGSSHVVGVYRWVDKVVKNQIYNYGKRMMFEFMIPEPAKLHNLGVKMIDESEKLVKPVDPREEPSMQIKDYTALSDETKLKFWISKYNVEIDERKPEFINIGKTLDHSSTESNTASSKSSSIKIPENYIAINAGAHCVGAAPGGSNGWGRQIYVQVGHRTFYITPSQYTLVNPDGGLFSKYAEEIPVSLGITNYHTVVVSFDVKCQLTQEAKNTWLQKAFNKIIEAYEVELEKYNQALSEAKALGVQIKGSNPGFYRKIENTILRKNCISYMISQNPFTELTFGKGKYHNNGFTSGNETFLNTDILVDGKLDQYAAFVKFMEQAFEWDIMSYYFYPFYWGDRNKWSDMYQFDDNDPTFRAFMQSGMARVIVTVRPGFEEAVRHFLATGKIWNGGEVPVIDDPLFLSIVDEMRAAVGKKQGEPWREKIPTSLTILQADSIGLRVEKALPCNCEPGVKFDDQLGEMCGSNFVRNNNQIGQPSDKWIEVSFDNLDSGYSRYSRVEEMDFPRIYECLNNTITIDRDASWLPTDSTIKIHKVLADEISSIEGIEAYTLGNDGITFKVNISKIPTFTFKKPGQTGEYDLFKFSVDLNNSTLKIMSPEYNCYGDIRILDKDGQVIPEIEYLDKVPLSKFLL